MSSVEDILKQLVSNPDCAISRDLPSLALPEVLPDDVRTFFNQTHGGRLFYHPDFATPQFGCELRFYPERPLVSSEDPLEMTFCEGAEFSHLYRVADFTDTGDYDFAAVSTAPAVFGHIYYFRYSLGDPVLTWDDRVFLAHSFSRWLEMHLEAWARYRLDWRDGLATFRSLCDRERRLYPEA